MKSFITIQVEYKYISISGDDKVIIYRRRNVKSILEDMEKAYSEIISYGDTNLSVSVEIDQAVDEAGQDVHILEILEAFDDKDDGRAAAKELADVFSEKIAKE